MRRRLVARLCVTLSFGFIAEFAFAGTVYELAFTTTELQLGVAEAVEVRTVYATLKLNGESPYDHTSVESLTFTPAAAELGYIGEYQGTFDESGGTLFDDGNGFLAGDQYAANTIADMVILGTFLVDFDPPPVAESLTNIPGTGLLLSFWPRGVIASAGETQGSDRVVRGEWVRLVPEPSAAYLATLFTISFVAINRG